MTVPEKLHMAEKLVALGVDILEAGFPIASEGDFEAVRAVAREFQWISVAALSRANRIDVERAAQALEGAKRPRIHTFIATSDIHLKYKLRKSRQEVLDAAVAAVRLARSYVDDVEFSAEDATRTDPDDLGLAVANSLAALKAGARQIECTINGIGERAGNCSLEEIVMIMKTRNDRYPFHTGIVTEELYPASQRLSSLISFGPQPNKAIVGKNAFAHEAGIHQDGYLKERSTYEIMDPKSVGVPEGKLVLGKHSGRHALKKRCEDLGFQLNRDEIEAIYVAFTAASDRKKGLMDEEIAELVRIELARIGAATASA
jgi:2-isopropylmalate synthase